MSWQDVLIVLIALEFLVIAICVVLVTYFLAKALRSFKNLSNSVKGLKPFIAIPALAVAIVSKIIKRR